MAYNSLLEVALKAFIVLISAQVALSTPVGGILIDGEEVRAGGTHMSLCDQCIHSTGDEAYIFFIGNPQIPNDNPLDKLTSVPEVVKLISLNRYESWCIGFIGGYQDRHHQGVFHGYCQ